LSADRLAKGLYWDRSLTLVSGCTPVSPGCDHCWSAREAHVRSSHPNEKIRTRTKGVILGGEWTGDVKFLEETLNVPIRTRKPTVYAVWNDLFHPGVTQDQVDRAFSVMASEQRHLFLVPTKRADRMREHLGHRGFHRLGANGWIADHKKCEDGLRVAKTGGEPLPNVCVGATTENQEAFDARIGDLAATPATLRWLSVEPMLSGIDMEKILPPMCAIHRMRVCCGRRPAVDWVVCGGESGADARPMNPNWVRGLRDFCRENNIPLLLKQWGEWAPAGNVDLRSHRDKPRFVFDDGEVMVRVGKKEAGRTLDGKEHVELPPLLSRRHPA